MSRKSNISLSNRAVFYSSRKASLQQHEESLNLNTVKKDLSKQKIANSSFQNWRYPRVRVRSQTFGDAHQSNKSDVTTVTGPLLSERAKGWAREGLKDVPSRTQPNSNDHTKASLSRVFSKVLRSNPKDISAQWLERVGFTFSPFAFIFGTTFFFAALVSTLQKQDGRPWLGTLSHMKLPGLTENKVRQRSSWVFLEEILSQYIKKDSSFLVSTPPILQDEPYSAQRQKAVPRTLTLARLKSTTGSGEVGGDLEVLLSPMWSQHIKKDFLGVFPLRRSSDAPKEQIGTMYRPSCLQARRVCTQIEDLQDLATRVPLRTNKNSDNCRIAEASDSLALSQSKERNLSFDKIGGKDCQGNERVGFVKPARSIPDPSLVRTSQLEKTLIPLAPLSNRRFTGEDEGKPALGTGIWPWYKIMAYHPANRLILPTWTDYTISEVKERLTDRPMNQLNVYSDQLAPADSSGKLSLEPKSFDFVRRERRGFENGTLDNSARRPRSPLRKFFWVADSLLRKAEVGKAHPFDKCVERLRLEDDSIPSKKESVYSKNKLHQDTLSARVLSIVKKSFYEYGLSIPDSCSALTRRDKLCMNSTICLTMQYPEDVDKLVDGETVGTDSSYAQQAGRLAEQGQFHLAPCTSKSHKSEAFVRKGHQNLSPFDKGLGPTGSANDVRPDQNVRKVGPEEEVNQELPLDCSASGDISLTKSEIDPEQTPPLHGLVGPRRERGEAVQGKRNRPPTVEEIEQASAVAPRSGAISSRNSHNSRDGLYSNAFGKQTRSSGKAKPILAGVHSVAEQFEDLRETTNLSEDARTKLSADRSEQLGDTRLSGLLAARSSIAPSKRSAFTNRRLAATVLFKGGRVIGSSATGFQLPKSSQREPQMLLRDTKSSLREPKTCKSKICKRSDALICYAKSGGLTLNFRNIAIPKRSFWENVHSLSGYNFPELQDEEVTDLFWKISASSQSKVGLVTRLCEAARTKLSPGTYPANRALNKPTMRLAEQGASSVCSGQLGLAPSHRSAFSSQRVAGDVLLSPGERIDKTEKSAITIPLHSYACKPSVCTQALRFGIDTNQVFLTPYLVKVPPQVLVTPSAKTEGLNLLSQLNKPVPDRHQQTRAATAASLLAARSGSAHRWRLRNQDFHQSNFGGSNSLARLPQMASDRLGLSETFVDVGANDNRPSLSLSFGSGIIPRQGLENQIFADDRPNAPQQDEQGRFAGHVGPRMRPFEEYLKVRYTPLELEQENKMKKAFKELGRDYSDYLRQPKDSLPALLLSPSLEEDKQIEEEEAQRLAYEKAAARAAAKRTHNDEEDSLSDSEGNHEFNTINSLDGALGERKKGDSNLEDEPINDEEIEDSRFERLRFTREVEAKKEEEDSRGLALSFTYRDSIDPGIDVARVRYPFRPFCFATNQRFVIARSPKNVAERSSCSAQQNTGSAGLDIGLRQHKLASSLKLRSCEFLPNNPVESPGVSDRKHSFFGQKAFSPTRLFSQEERLVSAHIVNPFIRYEQRNPWLIRGLSDPCSASGPYGVNQNQNKSAPMLSHSMSKADSSAFVKPALANKPVGFVRKPKVCKRSSAVEVHAERLLAQEEQATPFKIDEVLTRKNLQTQARLGFIRFMHLPVVEAASRTGQSHTLVSQVNPGSSVSADSASLRQDSANLIDRFTTPAPRSQRTLRNHLQFSANAQPTAEQAVDSPEGSNLQSTRPEQPLTRKIGNNNRIYKPDLRLRVTSLESSISGDWRNDRKAESSPFRVTSKERSHIVLPQLNENEWQKSLEWQLKRHFFEEDTRLEPLVATESYKTFKVKKFARSIPWLTLEKPSFKHFQWPYKTVGVLSISQDVGAVDPANRRVVTPLLQGLATVSQSGSKARLNNPKVYSARNKSAPPFSRRLRSQTEGLHAGASAFVKPMLSRQRSNRYSFFTEPLIRSGDKAHERLLNYSRIPLASSFTTYSKNRSSLSGNSSQLFDGTKKIFNSQDDFNTERLFEPQSASSWFLIYRLFLALILKEVFKYIYRISLKDFFIRIINSDFGRTITSPEFRQSVQFEPFPEFYKPSNRLKDLIGIKNALLPLSEIIWFLRNNCRSRSGPHGVVLLGPEGVDTTAIAQAVAGEAKVPIIVQSLRALTLTHSHPQKRLEKVLHLARKQSPCVLFLDELDAIGKSREGVIRNTSSEGNSLISLDSSKMSTRIPTQLQVPDDQTTSQGRRVDLMLRLLTVMDGLHHLNGVVIITTSKNTATLDPALLRPGRFDRLIHLTLPNTEHRMELFKVKTKELGHTDQLPWEYLSLRTENMGGTDIVSAINYSALRAIVNDTVHTVETLEYGLNCVKALKEKQLQTRSINYSY